MRTVKARDLPRWDDDYWIEARDEPLRRQLRFQQGWWRENRLEDLPPGPTDNRTQKNWRLGECDGTYAQWERLVVSMLPLGVSPRVNLMTDESVQAADRAREHLMTRGPSGKRPPGIIKPDRLLRNLLSSQPLCFNLFGHLSDDANALLPWVKTIAPAAAEVVAIKLEWAPDEETIGGSAFDAFVEYRREDGEAGFLGIECKYAEQLDESLTDPAAEKWVLATQPPEWRDGAAAALDRTGLRQFWYNQILTHVVARSAVTTQGDRSKYAEGTGVVVACDVDIKAREAVAEVSAQLTDVNRLQFSSLEDVLEGVQGHAEWEDRFSERYLDFLNLPERHRLT